MSVIRETTSLCPTCLKLLPARLIEDDGKIFMTKTCPDHGNFRDLYYGSAATYHNFMRYFHTGNGISNPHTQITGNCPERCGLCENHKSNTVLANLDVTNACNFKCPICFANSAASGRLVQPTLQEISTMMDSLRNEDPPCTVIQFSGGEPTIRKDLFEIARLAKEKGFIHVQIATNGKILAEDPEYAHKLWEADVDTVYLQFDGITPEPYLAARGFDALPLKLQAIENIRRNGKIPNIILVPTLVKGVNDDQIGDIIRFAAQNIDVVRGVNFQPVSFTGRIDSEELLEQRFTIADMLEDIRKQTGGGITPEDFLPVPAFTPLLEFLKRAYNSRNTPELSTHPVCGAWTYLFRDGERLVPLTRILNLEALLDLIDSLETANRNEIAAKLTTRLHKLIRPGSIRYAHTVLGLLKNIIFQGTYKAAADFHDSNVLFIGSMHFMDPYNFDTERLERCCIHYATQDGRVIPFCAYNTLYREQIEEKYARNKRIQS
ncbi:MAG: radical SAM protein [Calditrichia bacterium]